MQKVQKDIPIFLMYERCSRDHTDFLATRCEMGVLYNNYGIIGDVIVCMQFYVCNSTSFMLI